MRCILLSIIALLIAITSTAQKFEVKKVDFAEIKSETQNPKSKHFYPDLVKMYQSNDTLLTFDDYRYLYYGHTFQEDYNPFRQSVYSNKEKVKPLYYKQELTRQECDTIIKYANLTLNDDLFDINQMNFNIFALKQKKKFNLASIKLYKLNHIIAAILSSGNGTQKNPWVVITPSHEYDIINFLGYVATDHKELENHVDYITVEKKDGKSVEGFYFDASRIFEVGDEKYPTLK